MKRTYIKDLNKEIGREVVIKGWVNVRHDQGKMVFMDMRDMTGLVQCVVLSKSEAIETAKEFAPNGCCRNRCCKQATGEKYQPGVQNGDIELEVKQIEVLNKAETLPFDVSSDTKGVNEDARLNIAIWICVASGCRKIFACAIK